MYKIFSFSKVLEAKMVFFFFNEAFLNLFPNEIERCPLNLVLTLLWCLSVPFCNAGIGTRAWSNNSGKQNTDRIIFSSSLFFFPFGDSELLLWAFFTQYSEKEHFEAVHL